MPDSDPEVNELCDGDPLARALAKLQPMPTALGGTQLIYLAGQAARERTVAFWRRAFLAQTAVLAAVGGFAAWQFLQPAQTNERQQLVYREADKPLVEEAPMPRDSEPLSGPSGEFHIGHRPPGQRDDLAEYLRIRKEVMTAGLGLLPDAKSATTRPVNPTEFEKSLNLPPGVLTAPYRLPPPAEPPPE